MKNLTIRRLATSKSFGTFGVLLIDAAPFCVTLEPPDKENHVNVSSIPTGQYTIMPYKSPTHGGTWMVMDVTDRSYILFHPGTLVDHTEGCILLGESFFKFKGNRAIKNSGATFQKFLEELKGEPNAHLTITEVY